MPKFRYAKLVRDNIADWHTEHGHVVDGRRLSGNELIKALCRKLHEEADEVDGALTGDELVEEIADVQQILDDLCAVAGIERQQVVDARDKKLAVKGGFQAGQYIESVKIADENDQWAQYCRRSPAKYPEID